MNDRWSVDREGHWGRADIWVGSYRFGNDVPTEAAGRTDENRMGRFDHDGWVAGEEMVLDGLPSSSQRGYIIL